MSRSSPRRPWAGAWLALLALAACNDKGTGYVEIKAFPAFTAPLYLDTVKIETLRNGNAVLRQEVGRTKLQVERNGQLVSICELEVRKNRIVSVTISGLGMPRCDVQR